MSRTRRRSCLPQLFRRKPARSHNRTASVCFETEPHDVEVEARCLQTLAPPSRRGKPRSSPSNRGRPPAGEGLPHTAGPRCHNPVGRGPVCGAHDLPEARPMTKAPESHPSITVYTSKGLALYALFILGLSCSLVWRCPKRHLLDLYNRNVGTPHLDIGVGTGYFLDRCRFPVERPEITLLDLSDACLRKAASRLERYSPHVVKSNALDPLDLGTTRFASVGLNGVLHCLPASSETKAAIFGNLKPVLEDGGVVFGSTILGSGVEHSRL